ncbi:neuronal acetylcholine receptor subunit alpha-6-like isoform X2 [Dendronephthya gigantea]|uniref:neuronal acetylcholine receptor subunit alpha-6-like isoform X2 n=1 Tax=Dendronephthya gigantea TaxID=151771 RepID=UPI00106B2212|nr:neuronal acetylcholine receptor subunit alpha-6-like isoform X2 [Dendronephthya gigantea]
MRVANPRTILALFLQGFTILFLLSPRGNSPNRKFRESTQCPQNNGQYFVLNICIFLSYIDVNATHLEHEARLINDLLQYYDPDARPVKNTSHPIVITINLLYKQLKDVYWKDDLLKWNASEYGGSSRIRLQPSRIWKPDLSLYNTAKEDGGTLESAKFKVVVASNGQVEWFTYHILHSVCRIDVSKFPFDTQKCKMKIGSWTQDKLDLDLRLHKPSNGIDVDSFEKNTEWELTSASAQRNEIEYKCCPAPYVDITYSFEFRRKPLYYIMTIVFPSMLLALLASVSFLFPADSGERVSLTISVLLGLVVFMLIVNDRTPVTSDTVPMITQFFNAIGASTVLALMATAFILRLNHVSPGVCIPRYLVRIRNSIAVVLCIKPACKLKPVGVNADEIRQNNSFVRIQINNDNLAEQPLSYWEPWASMRKPLENIQNEVKKLSRHLEEEKIASEMKEDWHYTMRVFDRFFFVVFFLVFLAYVFDALFVYLTS